MRGPVERKKQAITVPFHPERHRGVDLRTVNFFNWKKQPVVMPERSRVLRHGIDDYGNDFLVVHPMSNPDVDELKFIHVTFERTFAIGEEIDEGEILGYSQVRQEIGRGNSYSHHLHFEVWCNGSPVNPLDYFDRWNINYEFKQPGAA